MSSYNLSPVFLYEIHATALLLQYLLFPIRVIASFLNNFSLKNNNRSTVQGFLYPLHKQKVLFSSSESPRTLPYPEPVKPSLHGHTLFIQNP
jgi:hypothetical protein